MGHYFVRIAGLSVLAVVLSTSILFGQAPSNLSTRPTFNCAKAKTSLPRLLCVDQAGAEADWDLVSASWARRFSLSENERDAFEQAENSWLKSLPEVCGLTPEQQRFSTDQHHCVLTAYHDRAAQYRSNLKDDALIESKLTPEQRAELQGALVALGFLNDTPDGEFGPKTRLAIKQFQTSNGSPTSEFLSSADQDLLQKQAKNRVTASQSNFGGPSIGGRPEDLGRYISRVLRGTSSRPGGGPIIFSQPVIAPREKDAQAPSAPAPTSSQNIGTTYYIRVMNNRMPFGTVATSSEICDALSHRVFGETAFFQKASHAGNGLVASFDRNRLTLQWLITRAKNRGIAVSRNDGFTPTEPSANIANENFTSCLRQLSANDPDRLRNIAVFLRQLSPTEILSCLVTPIRKEKVIGADGTVSEREIRQASRPCLDWRYSGWIDLGTVSENAWLSMIILREAHPALRSILDEAKSVIEQQRKKDEMAAQAAADAKAKREEERRRLVAEVQRKRMDNILAGIGIVALTVIGLALLIQLLRRRKNNLSASHPLAMYASNELRGTRNEGSKESVLDAKAHETTLSESPALASAVSFMDTAWRRLGSRWLRLVGGFGALLIVVVIGDAIVGPLLPHDLYCEVGAGWRYSEPGRMSFRQTTTGGQGYWEVQSSQSYCMHGTLWDAVIRVFK